MTCKKRKKREFYFYIRLPSYAHVHIDRTNVTSMLARSFEEKKNDCLFAVTAASDDYYKERKTASERNDYNIHLNEEKRKNNDDDERSQFLTLFYILSSVTVFRFKCKRKVVNLNGMCVVKKKQKFSINSHYSYSQLIRANECLFSLSSYRYTKALYVFNSFVLFYVHHSFTILFLFACLRYRVDYHVRKLHSLPICNFRNV